MESVNLFYFITSSVLLTLMPGPDIIFVITMSITQGRKSGISTALGLCTGLIFHTAVVSLGVSLLLQSSAVAFRILKYSGAAYLIYLAYLAFRERNETIGNGNSVSLNTKRLYFRGILMNILNPKVSIFFLAFLPQFVPQDTKNSSAVMAVLGFIFICQALIVFFSVSFLSGMLGEKLIENRRFSKSMAYLKIAVFILLGLNLILDIF